MTTVFITGQHIQEFTRVCPGRPLASHAEELSETLEHFFAHFPLSICLTTSKVVITVPLIVRAGNAILEPPENTPHFLLTKSLQYYSLDLTLPKPFKKVSDFRTSTDIEIPVSTIDLLRIVLDHYSLGFPWYARYEAAKSTVNLIQQLRFLPSTALTQWDLLEQQMIEEAMVEIYCDEVVLVRYTFHFPQPKEQKHNDNPSVLSKRLLSQVFLKTLQAIGTRDAPEDQIVRVAAFRRFLMGAIRRRDRRLLLECQNEKAEAYQSDLKDLIPQSQLDFSQEQRQVLHRLNAVIRAAELLQGWRFFAGVDGFNDFFQLGLVVPSSDVTESLVELSDLPPAEFNSLREEQRETYVPGCPLLRWDDGERFANMVERSGEWKLLSWCAFHFDRLKGWRCDYSARNFSYNLKFATKCSPYRVLRFVMVLLMRVVSVMILIQDSQLSSLSNVISLESAEDDNRPGKLVRYHRETLALDHQLKGKVTNSIENLERLCGTYL